MRSHCEKDEWKSCTKVARCYKLQFCFTSTTVPYTLHSFTLFPHCSTTFPTDSRELNEQRALAGQSDLSNIASASLIHVAATNIGFYQIGKYSNYCRDYSLLIILIKKILVNDKRDKTIMLKTSFFPLLSQFVSSDIKK